MAEESGVKDKQPKLGSPEWVEWMRRKRAAAVAAKGDESKPGRAKKVTRQEARERKLEELVPEAIRVLELQMRGVPTTIECPECGHIHMVDRVDAKIAQTAAIKLLEWGKGKPAQTIRNEGEQVHTIRYESAAIGPSLN